MTQGFYAAIPLSLTRAGISVIPIPTLITIGNVGFTVSPGSELFSIRLEADRDDDWTLMVTKPEPSLTDSKRSQTQSGGRMPDMDPGPQPSLL